MYTWSKAVYYPVYLSEQHSAFSKVLLACERTDTYLNIIAELFLLQSLRVCIWKPTCYDWKGSFSSQ